MAMLPFCGYNMADYWAHWLAIGRRPGARLPRVFAVNWFRKGADGKFLWPGYGENSRVLKWVFERCADKANGVETPIGILPGPRDLDVAGLDLQEARLAELLRVDRDAWLAELPLVRAYYEQFGTKLPPELTAQLDRLEQRLRAAEA
jgi:phosphoenolpyruvate carboxykinase (GTP)